MFRTTSILRLAGLAMILAISLMATVIARPPADRQVPERAAQAIDNTTYISANNILMFVTNHGNFGRDLSDYFGNDCGTYYPFTSEAAISSGASVASVLYAAGLWLGGIDATTGDTLVTVSEYASEYVPGPMSGGTFQPDRPEFHVYKLYRDSLGTNPNDDYLNWPVDQGAPVDEYGDPVMLGDQMMWTVFNDADPDQHANYASGTEPMGIEVQQTVWASNEPGDMKVPVGGFVEVTSSDEGVVGLDVSVAEPNELTGHDYIVVTDSTATEFVWHFIDVTTGDTLILNRPVDSCNSDVVAGFTICAGFEPQTFTSFEVVANAAGPIDPPESAAAPWELFPVPTGVDPDGYPTDGQQVGDGKWLISTGDDGGTNGDGEDRGLYWTFIERTFRGDQNRLARLANNDWEIRFTGSNDNPGVNGSYCWDAFGTKTSYWVPFELWRTGYYTPDDPSDDVRCIPYIHGDITSGEPSFENFVFDLSQYGSSPNGTCHDGCEHSVSGGDDDPYTDWLYWCVPVDDSPGDAGYQAFATAMQTDPLSYPFETNELRVMDRLVLVNWNGGEEPPFTQDMPEQGTVFRLRTGEPLTPDQTFNITASPVDTILVGPEQLSVYMKYVLINKGTRNLEDLLVGIWLDPDLGGAGDDLVGCDTLTETMFCYNATGTDSYYGFFCPAVGIKMLEGPIVPSPGDTSVVDGLQRPDFKNTHMYSFTKYVGGDDPDNYRQSYLFLKGLDGKNPGTSFINPITMEETRYLVSGDPVTGEGWLDYAADDRRMMSSYGPFDFNPGDIQQIVFKLAVGQGPDRLSSITALRQVLAFVPTPTGVDDDPTTVLPKEFSVEQNYPNPFNPATTISYSLPRRAEVEVAIFNVLGQTVATLDEGSQPAGDHSVVWKGVDDSGNSVATGVYFYRVRVGDNVSTKKMLLLK